MSEYYSYREVAVIIHKSENCVSQLVTKHHTLETIMIGKRPRVTRESLQASFPHELAAHDHIAILQGLISMLTAQVTRQKDARSQMKSLLASMSDSTKSPLLTASS